MNIKIGWIIPILIIIIIGISLSLSNKDDNEKIDEVEIMDGKHNVVINVKDYGEIYLELDADVAPITVTNFIYLANKNFYDGITFHRIIEGFMIQGGDPTGTGYNGSGTTIKGEFAANGIENSISHTRGTISMARNSTDYDSASSQFFIVHQDSTFLDGDYAAFGHVTKGMEVVDKIAETAEPIDNNGLIAEDKQPVIESVKVID
ncbi:MAG: peptidylprolyl isomerase [Erysipelotrichales bacterium]|nr:peptidylprolyl isomerase [Erysipelotrichales bacterium]